MGRRIKGARSVSAACRRGEVTVLVRHAGRQEVRVAATVAAGQTAVLDIELKAATYAADQGRRRFLS